MKTTEMIYCYHCNLQHPRQEMRLVISKSGKRWRCIQSIEAVRTGTRENREAFGRNSTANNRAEAQAKLRLRVRPDFKN